MPDGFVVLPGEAADGSDGPQRDALACALRRLGSPLLAVRSSAADEDAPGASAAGQYESVIGVRGIAEVCAAIATCRRSARAARVRVYRGRLAPAESPVHGVAVIVQRLVAADVAGVAFTPRGGDGPVRIEASWGQGLSVVGGAVTPDAYEVFPDGHIRWVLGSKGSRIDVRPTGGTVTTAVSADDRAARTLDDTAAAAVADVCRRAAAVFGSPQDIEWAFEDGRIRILQARPVTAPLPVTPPDGTSAPSGALTGTPGSPGRATARAVIVRGPSDFPLVRPGDILVCPFTGPAWTPLFASAAGVVTETGGTLSHAAIVAREYGIPAVLGVADATTRIETDTPITLDGSAGTVIPA